MITSIETLWKVIVSSLPKGKWFDITDIYKIVEENYSTFTADDLKQVTQENRGPTWKRNVRNALQSHRSAGELLYDGTAGYQLPLDPNSEMRNTFTPSDIIWFKNVTDKTNGEAYLDFIENNFVLHFPDIHEANVLTPKINDLILIHQKVNGIPAFTHLVTPIDNELIDEENRPKYRYGRRVRIIAKTTNKDFIPVIDTLWSRLTYVGISHGNACKISKIKNIGNIDELQFDIWQKFKGHFIPTEQHSESVTSSLIDELKTSDPDLTVIEGGLRLVSHMVRERNPKIVREKKQQALNNNTLHCKVCQFSFIKTFKAEYIECHHIIPFGQVGEREIGLDDLELVCANCHRMLHKKFDNQYLTIKQLSNRKTSLEAKG